MPKDGAECLIFSVKFARNFVFPHFQTQIHRLLKTLSQNSSVSTGQSLRKYAGQKIPAAGTTIPTKNGGRKNSLENASEKLQKAQNAKITPFFRIICSLRPFLHPFYKTESGSRTKYQNGIHRNNPKPNAPEPSRAGRNRPNPNNPQAKSAENPAFFR